ncbi:MAG: YIP1 family protein [Candidatus Aminicenantes bacterium]|nr:YIP1 family protein [Candidatus Aminicenantes bacterium]
MNIFSRLQGVFFNPKETFNFLSKKPYWLDALIIVLIAFTLFSYLAAPYQRQDSIQVWENSTKLRETLGEEAYLERIEQIKNPSQLQKVLGIVLAPLGLSIGLLISSLILLLMGRIGSLEGKYVQVFSALVHANFLDKILGNAIRIFLIFSKKSVMQTTTSLAILFPNLDYTSNTYIVLSQFDLFQLWLFGILAFGLSAIFKISLKRAMIISYGFWLLKSLLNIAMLMLSMRFV